jgi:2-oxo-4-hydroxy-4-carboxy-5-ureidoimidazoline decarboxylase
VTLDEVNALDGDAFVGALGAIFEHSPWVPERTWARRPFRSVEALHGALCATVAAAGTARQLDLIRAHPDLAGRAALRGELSEASAREQHGAGLDQCSPAEFARLNELNAAYRARFGFPFIVAVCGHGRASIIANLEARLGHTRVDEIAEALRQIEWIARGRLDELIR